MSLLTDIFGQKPKVPNLKPVDFNQVQKDAAQQNIDILPQADFLARKYNALNQSELDQLLNAQIPDLAGIKSNISQKLLSESAGELSPDVQAAVERSSVARSLGHAGGSMGGAWVARDIGRTSYDISNQALASTDRWLNTTRNYLTPQPFNMASMFVSPQERLAQVTEERNKSFEHDWLKSQVRAMPSPVAHAIWQSIDSYIHSYGGGNSYAPTQNPQMGGSPQSYNSGYSSGFGQGADTTFNFQGGDPGMVGGGYAG